MSLLDITELTHSFTDRLLFKDACLTLNRGEHIGIVGQNGAGKSTLIKICTEQLIPDGGRVVWQPNIKWGCLDQYAEIGDATIREFLQSTFRELYKIEQRMNTLYTQAAAGSQSALKQAARCQEELESGGFYSLDTRIGQVAAGLGLRALGMDRQIGQISGGQRAKLILAKLLLEKPDVLLLDEPDNFLDKEHVAWLQEYLCGLDNAYMVVSHNCAFLEKTANRICDIDNRRLIKYYGTYSEFLKKKTALRDDYVRQYAAQQREIKKTEEFIRKNIAGRKSKMARGRQKQLDRMEKMEALNQKEIRPVYHFPCLPVSKTEHLTVKCLSVGYDCPVLSELSFSVTGGQKVVITGFNGIGKSTLLKTLAGGLPALGGSFTLPEQVETGYFQQELSWEDKTLTPVQIVSQAFPEMTAREVRRCLSRCGLTARHAMQQVAALSGGEQAKVKLCLLTLRPCNFLILDEPTNHLDIQAKAALQSALAEFPGTVLLVSHEEEFYRKWAQQVINIKKL